MKIYFGSDHAGYELKEKLKSYLIELEYMVEDKGAFALDTNDDYPDFITPVAEAVASDWAGGEESFGIVLGGSGQGEAMCANRIKGARTAVFYGEVVPKGAVDMRGTISVSSFEIVMLERQHNNANILSLGIRFLTEDEAREAIKLFINTKFSGDERHVRRLAKF